MPDPTADAVEQRLREALSALEDDLMERSHTGPFLSARRYIAADDVVQVISAALRSGSEVAAAPGLDWHQTADDIEGAAHEALLGNAVQDRWFHHEVARIRSDAAARLTAKP